MFRVRLIILGMCLLMMTAGCRNRCYNPCGGGRLFAGGSPTIAPPPTYSLNIPSVAKNQPYYSPNNGNTGTLSTYGRAPTPANRQAQQAQPGWRAAGTDLSNTTNPTPPANNSDGRSVLATPTTFVNNRTTQPAGTQGKSVLAGNSGVVRTASATAQPGTGQSFTESRNYQTTRVDERTDPTRLAGTDASSVRAPARNYPTGYSASQGAVGYANQIPQTYVASNVMYSQPASSGYAGNPVLVGSPVGYQGQAMIGAPGYPQQYPQLQQYPTSSAPTVLAQSTVTANPSSSGSGTQLGWRDRDLTNGRTGRF